MQGCFKANPHSSNASVATVLAASIKRNRVKLVAAHVWQILSDILESSTHRTKAHASARTVPKPPFTRAHSHQWFGENRISSNGF